MSRALRSSTFMWIFLFCGVSFIHSYNFHLSSERIHGFYSTFKDIIAIGAILTFASICLSFLFFIWLTYLIGDCHKSSRNLIKINAIMLIPSAIAFVLIKHATASWSESFVYVGSYAFAFFIIINLHFFKVKLAADKLVKRYEVEDPAS